MTDVAVVLPKGIFGPCESDLLDAMIRAIAVAAAKGDASWPAKYGADVENDVFSMAPYCWCEHEDCELCLPCTCPASAMHYFVDGKEVSYDEWMSFYDEYVGRGPERDMTEEEHRERMARADEANKRRSQRKDPVCANCKKEPKPNFHYKPLDLRVRWYKYIARDMVANKQLSSMELAEMFKRCLESVAK